MGGDSLPIMDSRYHQRLKDWIQRFHGVSTNYLPHYLGWFRWFDHYLSKNNQPYDFMADFMMAERFQHLAGT